MRVQSRQIRLTGCSITQAHVEQIWELARLGFAKPDESSLVMYRHGDVEVRTATLEELFDEIGDFRALDNLTLIAGEDDPRRYVRLDIGPGRGAIFTVEADDHTWALGRCEEVKDALNQARGWVARTWDPLASRNKVGPRLLWTVLFALAIGAGYGLVYLGMGAWQAGMPGSLSASFMELVRSPLPYALVSYLGLFGAGDRWRRNKLRSYVSRNKPRAADGTSVTSLGIAVLSFGTAMLRIFGT